MFHATAQLPCDCHACGWMKLQTVPVPTLMLPRSPILNCTGSCQDVSLKIQPFKATFEGGERLLVSWPLASTSRQPGGPAAWSSDSPETCWGSSMSPWVWGNKKVLQGHRRQSLWIRDNWPSERQAYFEGHMDHSKDSRSHKVSSGERTEAPLLTRWGLKPGMNPLPALPQACICPQQFPWSLHWEVYTVHVGLTLCKLYTLIFSDSSRILDGCHQESWQTLKT